MIIDLGEVDLARLSRIKILDETAWYHVCARVAGWLDWYPLDDPAAREELQKLIKKYLEVFCCEAAAFCLMGNHYHLVLCFQPFKILSREELHKRAKILYRNPEIVLLSDRHWERFNHRIFDLSEFMRSLQAEYARWYNKNHHRRGALWSERFKSVLLENGESVLDAVLYVELNPVRAGLIERPEDWRWSSASHRFLDKDQWLLPLTEFCPSAAKAKVKSTYHHLLYYRGGVQAKHYDGVIPEIILESEASRGFAHPGVFSSRLKFFSNGLVLGSEIQIREWISKFRKKCYYRRRKHPVVHRIGNASIYSLRGQRYQQTNSILVEGSLCFGNT